MVVYYFPLNSSVQCLAYTFSIPPYWGGSSGSITIKVPVGAIAAGSSGGGTYTIAGVSTTPTAQVLRNGSAFSTPTVNTSNTAAVSTKSFAITTLGSAYSMYSYYNSYCFTFTPTQSTTTTYTYTCYLTFSALSIDCTLNTVPAYVPSNYGIVINPVSSTNTLTNATYSSSADSTGYLTYGYTVNNVFVPATTPNGYAVFDSIYCNKIYQKNTGLISNIRAFASVSAFPVVAETTNPNLVATTYSMTNSGVINSIFLTQGQVLSGIWLLHRYTSTTLSATLRPVLYSIEGTILASGSSSIINLSSYLRRRYAFTSSYTVPTSGYYFVGMTVVSTAALDMYVVSAVVQLVNDYAGATTTDLATVGSASFVSGSGALVNLQTAGYTYTYRATFYFALY
jgi:hypothetical protein